MAAYPTMRDGATAAVRYMGAPVFPCKAKGKEPATPHGFKDASTDPERVAEWWPHGSNRNVGMATGEVVVIDFDDHGDEGGLCGFDALETWEADHAPLNRDTVRVKSGRGRGEHWYYRAAPGDEIRNATGGDSGVDVRGAGGYVLVPPSLHPRGTEYRYINDPADVAVAPLGEAERAFIDHVRGASKGGGKRRTRGRVPVGGRNNAVFLAGIKAQDAGLSDDDVALAVLRANDECDPPLGAAEIERTLTSVLSYGKGEDGELVGFLRDRGVGAREMNDKALARLFAGWTRGVLAYCPDAPDSKGGAWLSYDGRHWAAQGAEQMAELHLKRFIDGLASYTAATFKDDVTRQSIYKGVARYQAYRARRNVLADARSELVTPWGEFDRNPHLLNLQNGTLDLTGEPVFRAHDPADLITRIAPGRYDPEAAAPEFARTVARAMQGDVSLIEYVQKLFGKMIAGDASDDCMHFFGEAPRSGKGTITGPMLDLLGVGPEGYARAVQPETLSVRAFSDAGKASGDLARLAGARVAVLTEPPEGMELDAERVKQLTGGDYVTARFLYGREFSYKFRGVLVMQANRFPEISDPSVWDSGRVRVVPFGAPIPPEERDPGLRARLCDPGNLPGVLNWALDGVRLYRAEGFDPPAAVRAATEAYRVRSDELENFFAACTVRERGALVTCADMYSAYSAWSGGAGMTRRQFSERVRNRVPVKQTATIDGKTRRGVAVGLRLKASD